MEAKIYFTIKLVCAVFIFRQLWIFIFNREMYGIWEKAYRLMRIVRINLWKYRKKRSEQKERSQQNFIQYFDTAAKKRHANSSESIIVNWKRTYELLKLFAGDTLPFSKIDNRFAEDFRLFLLSAPCGGNKSGTISQNTAATYFSIFKAALKQAFVDGYLTIDLSAKIKGIQEQETRREFLTVEELNTLAATPCEYKDLKRAALFSALTGLRHCDIQKMQWKEIQIDGDQARLNFTQKKNKRR